jgi:hypothetical protein
MQMLTAKWGLEQDIAYDDPQNVYWNDDRPADFEQYLAHRSDTRVFVLTEDGVELRMYPAIIADVRYDAFHRLWFVVPRGGDPISLDLSDPDATDEEIRAALLLLPLTYRALIHH